MQFEIRTEGVGDVLIYPDLPAELKRLPKLAAGSFTLGGDWGKAVFLYYRGDGFTLAFNDYAIDRNTLHDWVNQPYTRRYWQLNLDKESLITTYSAVLNNPRAHSFIGLFNDKMACQIDLYNVGEDELKEHVEVTPGNCGLHILMLPPRQSFKGLTESMLKAFIRFYFSFSAAGCLYGEPDSRNTAANIAALRAGFKFMRAITLSYKTANLYSITKQQFHATHPII